MILTLILDFSEHFVSLSYAAATTARGTFAAATTAHGTFAVSAHAALRRCRTRRRPAFLAISTDYRNFNSPRKLEMRRSRFSGTTDSTEASLQIARPIRGGGFSSAHGSHSCSAAADVQDKFHCSSFPLRTKRRCAQPRARLHDSNPYFRFF